MIKARKLVFIALMGISACASSFPYQWYGMQLPDYSKGSLLGENKKDDLPISRCEPDATEKGKCVVLLVDEFDRLMADYAEMKLRLKGCEEAD